MRSPIVPDDPGRSADPGQLPGAIRFAGWLLIGQSAVFGAATIFAIRDLVLVPTVPVERWESPAEVHRFRAVLTSVERDRIFLFVLLAVAFLVVGAFLLRRPGIGTRYALLGLNVLLASAWGYTLLLSIDRLDEPDVVYGMIASSGISTGLSYFGLSGALVVLLVDILALTNPSTNSP